MESEPRVALILGGAAHPRLYDLAVAIAEMAWDSGAAVRLLRLGENRGQIGAASNPDLAEPGRASEAIPEVTLADLAWANAALFIASPARLLDGSVLGCGRSVFGPRAQSAAAALIPG